MVARAAGEWTKLSECGRKAQSLRYTMQSVLRTVMDNTVSHSEKLLRADLKGAQHKEKTVTMCDHGCSLDLMRSLSCNIYIY